MSLATASLSGGGVYASVNNETVVNYRKTPFPIDTPAALYAEVNQASENVPVVVTADGKDHDGNNVDAFGAIIVNRNDSVVANVVEIKGDNGDTIVYQTVYADPANSYGHAIVEAGGERIVLSPDGSPPVSVAVAEDAGNGNFITSVTTQNGEQVAVVVNQDNPSLAIVAQQNEGSGGDVYTTGYVAPTGDSHAIIGGAETVGFDRNQEVIARGVTDSVGGSSASSSFSGNDTIASGSGADTVVQAGLATVASLDQSLALDSIAPVGASSSSAANPFADAINLGADSLAAAQLVSDFASRADLAQPVTLVEDDLSGAVGGSLVSMDGGLTTIELKNFTDSSLLNKGGN